MSNFWSNNNGKSDDGMNLEEFNRDFYLNLIIVDVIKAIGTEMQKFVLLVNTLEQMMYESEAIPADYEAIIATKIKQLTDSDAVINSSSVDEEIAKQVKQSMIKFPVLFGIIAKQKPIEFVDESSGKVE